MVADAETPRTGRPGLVRVSFLHPVAFLGQSGPGRIHIFILHPASLIVPPPPKPSPGTHQLIQVGAPCCPLHLRLHHAALVQEDAGHKPGAQGVDPESGAQGVPLDSLGLDVLLLVCGEVYVRRCMYAGVWVWCVRERLGFSLV